MNGSPSDFFGPGNIGPVEHAGRELWLAYWITAQPADRLHLLFESFSRYPRQGLRVRCRDRRHTLRVNASESSSLLLWTDTAPKRVEVEVPAGRVPREIGVTNVWELPEYGTTMQGLGAAAMAVSRVSEGETLLECSDGYGSDGPDFGDLIVRLILERA